MSINMKYGSVVKISGIYLAILLASFVVTKAYAGGQAQYQISIEGFEFVPHTLNVMQGDTVIWVNHDIVPHSIVIRNSKEAILPVLESGETFTYIVGNSLAYRCGLHPSMKGTLSVP